MRRVGITEPKEASGQPVWAEWDFAGTGNPDTFSFFFQGRNVMNLYSLSNNPTALPRMDVSSYDEDGKLKVVWADRSGQGMFTERTFYRNGEPRMELWYQDRWQTVDQQDGRGGIVIDGVWREVRFTNGSWTTIVESPQPER